MNRLWGWLNRSGPPAPAPGLSPALLGVMVFTFLAGLPLDRWGAIAGQLVVSAWTWGVFLVLLARVDPQLRRPLMLCLLIATAGEFFCSLVWGVYVYWAHNVPPFVPPGHVLLFALGLTWAPRMPVWSGPLAAAFAGFYGVAAWLTGADTISALLALVFLLCMGLGSNRRLYATMFVLALVMELYGTWIGNWVWTPQVPVLSLTSANPPLCVGVLYCLLDLLVVNAERALRRWRGPVGAALQAGSAA